MSEAEAKVTEKQSSTSMPTLIETPEEGVPTDLPTEAVLAILFTMSKKLGEKALAQVMTGHTPKGEVVTYIKMIGVQVDKEKGFVLADQKSANGLTESVGNA